MKYIKVIIAVLLLVLVVIAVYYAYLVTKSPKLPQRTAAPTYQETVDSRPFVTNIHDFTSADATDGKPLKIKGVFQIADPAENVINGVTYNYVVGILGSDNNLSKVWLTSFEFDQIGAKISDNIKSGDSVTITLTKDTVSIEKP